MKISDLISILQEFEEDLEIYTHWEGTFHEVDPENVYMALEENIRFFSEEDQGPVLIIDADLHERDKAGYQRNL